MARRFVLLLAALLLPHVARAQQPAPFRPPPQVNVPGVPSSMADRLRQVRPRIAINSGPAIPKPAEPPVYASNIPTLPVDGIDRFKPIDPRLGVNSPRYEHVDPRIINGRPARIEDFPWQVLMINGRYEDPVRAGFCGGSIIGPTWVLTAAHCLDGREFTDIDIVAGSAVARFPGQGQRLKAKRLVVHPRYRPGEWHDDVALIELRQPVSVGHAIDLPASDLQLPSGVALRVSGWGAVVRDQPMVETLLFAEMPIVDNQRCNARDSYSGQVQPTMLCAGFDKANVSDACQGDSGGPGVVHIGDHWVQVGIVSWGVGCAMALKYGVYTRLPSYVAWVQTEASR